MTEELLWLALTGTVLNLVLLIVLMRRHTSVTAGEKGVAAELRAGRQEAQATAKAQRDEVSSGLDRISATLDSRLKTLEEGNDKKLEEMRKTVDEKL